MELLDHVYCSWGGRRQTSCFLMMKRDAVGTCVVLKARDSPLLMSWMENMDIVEWDEDPVFGFKNALNPAEVIDVYLNEEEHECVAVVPIRNCL